MGGDLNFCLSNFRLTLQKISAMTKTLFTIFMLYLAYRFFFARPGVLQRPGTNEKIHQNTNPTYKQNPPSKHTDEYIDYEEIE